MAAQRVRPVVCLLPFLVAVLACGNFGTAFAVTGTTAVWKACGHCCRCFSVAY
jgi:hypothetical protein